ncbi:hypothetical protein [Cyanobacterium sp. Dongsha4]|uniref:hypothetical protein n=1 Tax=Cyanobacterium sp. DS4 TaxID=2878255 RepID=UPI002E8131B5|nr:hypothetical protein [Cyanobacterium sp. Dongsha4]WVL01644.1 hypothetical protein Dongsha4_05500 [Cyanobacterium sp. Dongsha4]
MTSKPLQIEGTWEEILLQGEKLAGHRVRVTIINDHEINSSPEDTFRNSWKEIKEGKIRPISELWKGIDTVGFNFN